MDQSLQVIQLFSGSVFNVWKDTDGWAYKLVKKDNSYLFSTGFGTQEAVIQSLAEAVEMEYIK
jgi:hypothetical protein